MVTGERDVGKTTFALECGTPIPNIAFFDHDIKTSSLVTQLKQQDVSFGKYLNLVDFQAKMTEIEFHDFCVKAVADLPDTIETLIWDNFSPFESTMHPKILQDPNKYRQTWARKGDIKGAQQWLASFDLEEGIVSNMLAKVPLVIITFHLKSLNKAGVNTDKMIAAAKRVVPQKSNLSLWLRMNEKGGGVPIGLVLKRPGKATLGEDKTFKMVNVLPRKIDPCTWENVRKYWEEPVEERDLTPEEIPNIHELSILDGTLSPDQRKSFELMLKYGRPDDTDEITNAQEVAQSIKDYKDENPDASPAEIKESLDLDLSIPKIIQILNSGE